MLLTCGTAAAAWSAPLRAQQTGLPLIGFISSWSPDATTGKRAFDTFKRGLAEAGFEENTSVAIVVRWADGHYGRFPELIADLIRQQVKVIAAGSTPTVLAAKAQTTTIPIVFALASDPVALGLVQSLARPGGNITGSTRLNVELSPKKLQLLRNLVPTATKLALLVNPANPAITDMVRPVVQAASRAMGVELLVLHASDEKAVEAAFAEASKSGVGGMLIAPDGLFQSRIEMLGALTRRYALPTMYTDREFVAAGGLASYGGSFTDYFHVMGSYTGRILKGEKPADMPVQQSTKVELFINLATAKELNVTIPTELLLSANEVIE